MCISKFEMNTYLSASSTGMFGSFVFSFDHFSECVCVFLSVLLTEWLETA